MGNDRIARPYAIVFPSVLSADWLFGLAVRTSELMAGCVLVGEPIALLIPGSQPYWKVGPLEGCFPDSQQVTPWGQPREIGAKSQDDIAIFEHR